MAPGIALRIGAALVLLPAGSALGDGVEPAGLTFSGATVETIDVENRLFLGSGVVVDGDARLAAAIRAGDDLEVLVIETYPPRYVVRYADGERRRYRASVASPRR